MARKLKWFSIFSLALILAFSLTGQALAAEGKPQPPGLQRVIVMFEDGVNGADQNAIISSIGGKSLKSLDLINGMVALIPPMSEKGLEHCQGVWHVEPDGIAEAAVQMTPWGVDRIDAELVHSSNTGAGVKVAVIDTGVDYTHPDLDANFDPLLLGYDFVNEDPDPMDDHGHGTHVAGTIAAEDNDMGVVGVAPEASLYALKVLSSSGSGYYSDIVDALEWCVANGMQVASMSLGGTSSSSSLQTACNNAYNAGVLVVAAAGNSGSNSILYPAKYDSVIAVSATDSSDNRASFSCYGSENELAAPGVSIPSTLLGGGYGYKSGTSMATPHVSGVAALVIASGITGSSAVRAQLNNTAEDLGASGWDIYFGNGLVDAQAAASSPIIATGSIAGTVSDNTGDPIANAIVTAGGQSTTTAGDGSYTLADLPVGTYTVSASAADYDPASREGVIVEDSHTTPVNFTLTAPQPTGSISGTVTDDTGDPIANATVTAGGQSATTAENGSYTLAGLPVGTYDVTASAAGYGPASRTEVDVLENHITNDINFALEQLTGTISGTVTGTDTGHGIENATVTAGGQSTYTDASGYYTITDLPVGRYSVTASAAGYVDASQTVDVLEDQTTADTNFALAPQPDGNYTDMYVWSIDLSEKIAGKNTFLYVTVTISRDSDADGIAELSDSEVEGAAISLRLSNNKGKTWTYAGYTDATGQTTFSLRKAPGGTYTALVTGLTHSTYDWNSDLDVQNPSDSYTIN